MTARSFVDSNVLLYSGVPHLGEEKKCLIADQILDNGQVAMSVQVLQEFYVQATRASRANRLSHLEAMEFIQLWKRFPIQEITLGVLDAALIARERYGISYWDAAIIEAARAQGCREVLSEDLADGQDYAGVRVVNPFA